MILGVYDVKRVPAERDPFGAIERRPRSAELRRQSRATVALESELSGSGNPPHLPLCGVEREHLVAGAENQIHGAVWRNLNGAGRGEGTGEHGALIGARSVLACSREGGNHAG